MKEYQRFLYIKELQEILGGEGKPLSRGGVYALQRGGTLPEGVKLGRLTRWPSHEIEAIVKAREAGANGAQLRTLVDKLHAARAEALARIFPEAA